MIRSRLYAAALLACAAALPSPAQEGAGDKQQQLESARDDQKRLRAEERERRKAERRKTTSDELAQERDRLGVAEKDMPPEESRGFFVQAEGAFTQVTGADDVVARQYDMQTTATNAAELDTDGDGLPDAFVRGAGRDVSLEYDGQATPVIEVGFRRRTGGAFSLRWWDFTSSAAATASASTRFATDVSGMGDLVLGGIDAPTLPADAAGFAADPAGFERPFGAAQQLVSLGLHGADSVTAKGRLEASRMDFLFTRTALARRRTEVIFHLGLTRLETSRTESAHFTWTSFARSVVANGRVSEEDVTVSASTEAIGPCVGVAGRWGLTQSRKWSLRAGIDLAGLSANQKLRFTDAQALFEPAGQPLQPLRYHQDVTDDDAGQFVSIIGGDVGVDARMGRFRFSAGYRASRWLGALTEERFPRAGNPAALTSSSVDLDVRGPYVRVGIFF